MKTSRNWKRRACEARRQPGRWIMNYLVDSIAGKAIMSRLDSLPRGPWRSGNALLAFGAGVWFGHVAGRCAGHGRHVRQPAGRQWTKLAGRWRDFPSRCFSRKFHRQLDGRTPRRHAGIAPGIRFNARYWLQRGKRQLKQRKRWPGFIRRKSKSWKQRQRVRR